MAPLCGLTIEPSPPPSGPPPPGSAGAIGVGGIATQFIDGSDSPARSSELPVGLYAAITGGAVAALVALAAGGWYARRRRLR